MADSVVTVRVATHHDVDKILQVSEGIYDGRDYLPVVLEQWLNYERKLIYLAEYEGEVIGLQVADIAEDQQSFVTQALRIHPKYRGRRLSYQVHDAVMASILVKFPEMKRNRVVCFKDSVAYVMYRNKGFITVWEEKVQFIKKIPSDQLRQSLSAEFSDSGELTLLGIKDALELYKSEKVLDLMGPHSLIMDHEWLIRHKLPDDANSITSEANVVFVDVSLEEFQRGQFPKSFSQGFLSKRVATDIWICQVYTDDIELCKKHFLRQLNAAVQRIQRKEFVIYFFQRSSQIDGCKLVKDEFSRLKLNCMVESEARVDMEYFLNR